MGRVNGPRASRGREGIAGSQQVRNSLGDKHMRKEAGHTQGSSDLRDL